MKPKKKSIILNNEEKLIFGLLKKESPVLLKFLKEKVDLSNKKWDKAIKGLTQNKLAKVTKDEQGLWLSLVS